MSNWVWDIPKAKANESKHGVSFELASGVFLDPFNISEPDYHPDGDR